MPITIHKGDYLGSLLINIVWQFLNLNVTAQFHPLLPHEINLHTAHTV